MKKGYKILTALAAVSMVFSLQTSAQALSGVYTINSALATGGSNFQTFNALAAVINTAGVNGPVTVNVAANSGPYVEQVEFLAITGTSATNSIVINGNNNVLTFGATVSGAPHTMALNGTDFMTVNSLTVVGTGATYAMVVHLWNGANTNRFNACRIEAPLVGTGAALCPFSISNSGTSVTTSGNSGNGNVLIGSTMVGGVRGVSIYGNTTTPYTQDNQVIDNTILDFHTYGIYSYYTRNTLNRNNLIQRLNRTVTATTVYGIYTNYGCYPALIEKNKIRRIFDGIPGNTATLYGYFVGGSAVNGTPNTYINNLLSDISSNGSIYGMYEGGYGYNNFYHNSIILDNTTSTGGTCYGIMNYAPTSEIRNNLISINRTGSGTKSCFYLGTNSTVNNNILFNNSPAGFNSLATFNGTGYTTLALWQQGTSLDMNSASANPNFNNPTLYDYTPTTLALNNTGTPLGVTTDINNLNRFSPSPDAGAFEFFNQPCTTVSGTNAIISPTYVVCQSSQNALTLANTFSVVGLTFTWQQSVNQIGPYTAIPNATLASFTTPTLGASMYYNVLIGCVNGGTSLTPTAAFIQVATTVTNTPPYFEGFENINVNKDLPNCSWSRTDNFQCGSRTGSVSAWRQARTGTKFGEFDASNNVYSQTRNFFSNGLWLNAGVTYSASVWYATPGNSTWYNIGLYYGPNQSTSGLTLLSSVQYPTNTSYESLSNTFSVATTGFYYLSVQATEAGWAQQVVWDDLALTIPCSAPSNSAGVVVAGSSTVCAGQPLTLIASGAGTYTWSTGPNTPNMTANPTNNITYSVTGTNTLSGCSNTVLRNITVHQLPAVSIITFDSQICPGEMTTMHATSANSYTWSAGPTFGSMVNVSPAATTIYTVAGTNALGCVNTATQMVTVNPSPIITVTGNTIICEGQTANLTALGATTFTWKANNAYLQAPLVNLSPMVTTAYTVTGTDATTKCKGFTTVVVAVDPCVGIRNINGTTVKTLVYPNPSNGAFTVELNDGLAKTIDVIDVTGRIVLSVNSGATKTEMNISTLSNGVYYVKVKSDSGTDVIKVVKH